MNDSEINEALTDRPKVLADASSRAVRYLSLLEERSVQPETHAIEALETFDIAMPKTGVGASKVIAMLDEFGSPATIASAGPRFFGFVNGGALPVAVAAAWLLAAWDQNVALDQMSPVGGRLDKIAISWVAELLGLGEATGGGFVSGATMANATGLATARDEVLRRSGWDAIAEGLVGSPPIQVFVGEEAHTTVRKALGLVGLGRDRVIRLASDREGRILARDLPKITGPAIVCLQAGNVNSGASDPFEALIPWAKDQGAWVHIDGAFGLWAAASPELQDQVRGFEHADSWATDAHKWLNTTYDCGIALVADQGALRDTMQASASYLPSGARDPMRYTPQSSQRARGAEVWAVLTCLGQDGVADLIAGSCRLARRFADGLVALGFEVLNDVCLNQIVVDLGSPERASMMIEAIQRDGTCWCGPTTWRSRHAMRISVSCWATTESDVDRSLAAIGHLASSAT